MGDITIKIPQDTNGTFEITDRDVAERMLRDLKKNSVAKKRPISKKKKDFSELSAFADKLRAEPDAEMFVVSEIAEKLRKGWDR